MSSIRKPGDNCNDHFSIPPEAHELRLEMESFAAALTDFESSAADYRGAQFADLPLPEWEFGPNDVGTLRAAMMARPEDELEQTKPLILPVLSLNGAEKRLEMVAVPVKPGRHGDLAPSMNIPLRHSQEMLRFLRSAPRFMEIYHDVAELLKALHVYQQKRLGITGIRRFPFEPLRALAAAQAISFTPSPALYTALAPSVMAEPLMRRLIETKKEIDVSFDIPTESGLLSLWLQDHGRDIPSLHDRILARQNAALEKTINHFSDWLRQYESENIPLVSMRPSVQSSNVFDHSEPFSSAFAAAMRSLSDTGNDGGKE